MTLGKRHRTGNVALSVFLLLACGPALAATTKVVKLNSEKISLYDASGKKIRDFPRDQFKQPWQVTGESKTGLLPVIVDGNPVWVRTFAVTTDQPVLANKECDAVVAAREPKACVTRGLGEGCGKEKKK